MATLCISPARQDIPPEPYSLRYLLQAHGWIDALTPLHLDGPKVQIQNETIFPLWRVMPPVEEIHQYYGPEIAYYFAFMGFLGQRLLALGLIGLAAFLFR